MSANKKPVKLPSNPPAKAESEYISGGSLASALSNLNSLPRFADSVELLAGYDVYARMQGDSTVTRALWTLIYAAISDGLAFSPAVSQPAQVLEPNPEYLAAVAEYEKAKEYSDFMNRMFESLVDTPIRGALEQVLATSVIYGHSVAELVYEIKEYGPDSGKIVLSKIKPKPRYATALVVDKFYNVVGVVYADPSTGQAVTTGTVVDASSVLPRHKILVLPFRRVEGDPLGRSILGPVYNAWNVKQMLWPMMVKYVSHFAVPSLKGFVAPGEGDQPVISRNADGTIKYEVNSDGSQKYESATDAMGRALIALQNGTVFVGKNGASVDTLDVTATTQDLFGNLIRLLDEQETGGILLQTLATSEGIHSTRAQSETHMRVLDVFVFAIRQLMCEVLTSDVTRNVIEWNFGREALALIPRASLGDTERRDFAGDLTAISAGVTSGFIDPSQFAELDVQVGLPRRDLAAMNERAKLQLEAVDALADVRRARVGTDIGPNPGLDDA